MNVKLIALPIEFKVYLQYLSQPNDYCIEMGTGESQGSCLLLNTKQGPVYAGVKYFVTSARMLKYFLISTISLLIFSGLVFIYFARSISSDISNITHNLEHIAKGQTVDLNTRLPVTFNDEIGDLTVAFNTIQHGC